MSAEYGIDQVNFVGQSEFAIEVYRDDLGVWVPSNLNRVVFTVFDVCAVDIGCHRAAEASGGSVVNGAIGYKANVVFDEVSVLAILPRIEFNPKTWVESVEPKRPASLTKRIGSYVLQHEHHSVGTGGVQCPKIHGEVEVERLCQINEFRIPYGPVLVAQRRS